MIINIFNIYLIALLNSGFMVYTVLRITYPQNNTKHITSSLKPHLIYDWIIVANRLAPTLTGSAVNHIDSMSASKARG